jgi:hypothetical protein
VPALASSNNRRTGSITLRQFSHDFEYCGLLSGWDLNLGDNFRLELFRTDFSTPAETAYSKCEVLFRSLSSVTIALTPIPGSALRVERVEASAGTNEERVHIVAFGDAGTIEVAAKEHVVIMY